MQKNYSFEIKTIEQESLSSSTNINIYNIEPEKYINELYLRNIESEKEILIINSYNSEDLITQSEEYLIFCDGISIVSINLSRFEYEICYDIEYIIKDKYNYARKQNISPDKKYLILEVLLKEQEHLCLIPIKDIINQVSHDSINYKLISVNDGYTYNFSHNDKILSICQRKKSIQTNYSEGDYISYYLIKDDLGFLDIKLLNEEKGIENYKDWINQNTKRYDQDDLYVELLENKNNNSIIGILVYSKSSGLLISSVNIPIEYKFDNKSEVFFLKDKYTGIIKNPNYPYIFYFRIYDGYYIGNHNDFSIDNFVSFEFSPNKSFFVITDYVDGMFPRYYSYFFRNDERIFFPNYPKPILTIIEGNYEFSNDEKKLSCSGYFNFDDLVNKKYAKKIFDINLTQNSDAVLIETRIIN